MTSMWFTYLNNGDFLGALNSVYNNYIPYGLFWIFIGILVFGVVFGKTKSYSISTVIFILYSSIAGFMIPKEVQVYFYLIIGIMLTAMFVKMIRG